MVRKLSLIVTCTWHTKPTVPRVTAILPAPHLHTVASVAGKTFQPTCTGSCQQPLHLHLAFNNSQLLVTTSCIPLPTLLLPTNSSGTATALFDQGISCVHYCALLFIVLYTPSSDSPSNCTSVLHRLTMPKVHCKCTLSTC